MLSLTIKVNDKQNLDFLINLLSKFSFVEEIQSDSKENLFSKNLPMRKAQGRPSINDFAGMWQENPKTLEQIGKNAWKRTT